VANLIPKSLENLAYQPSKAYRALARLPLGRNVWDFLRANAVILVDRSKTSKERLQAVDKLLRERFGTIIEVPHIKYMIRQMIGQILSYQRAVLTQQAVFEKKRKKSQQIEKPALVYPLG
jgi:hypothetical protein